MQILGCRQTDDGIGGVLQLAAQHIGFHTLGHQPLGVKKTVGHKGGTRLQVVDH